MSPGAWEGWNTEGVLQEEGDSHDGDSIVVENSRDIFRGKLVGGVANEQASFADSTVADNHAPAK